MELAFSKVVKIRQATREDAGLLAEIGAKMFSDTFAQDNTPENMAAYLKKSFSPEIQLDELQDPRTTFFIAEVENQPVGFVSLSLGMAPDCITGRTPIELVRIYADKEWIGLGIGAKLMEHSIWFAKEQKHDSIWLDVWSRNPRAIRFYEKWGFRVVGEQDFLLGADIQNDYLMEKQL